MLSNVIDLKVAEGVGPDAPFVVELNAQLLPMKQLMLRVRILGRFWAHGCTSAVR